MVKPKSMTQTPAKAKIEQANATRKSIFRFNFYLFQNIFFDSSIKQRQQNRWKVQASIPSPELTWSWSLQTRNQDRTRELKTEMGTPVWPAMVMARLQTEKATQTETDILPEREMDRINRPETEMAMGTMKVIWCLIWRSRKSLPKSSRFQSLLTNMCWIVRKSDQWSTTVNLNLELYCYFPQPTVVQG